MINTLEKKTWENVLGDVNKTLGKKTWVDVLAEKEDAFIAGVGNSFPGILFRLQEKISKKTEFTNVLKEFHEEGMQHPVTYIAGRIVGCAPYVPVVGYPLFKFYKAIEPLIQNL